MLMVKDEGEMFHNGFIREVNLLSAYYNGWCLIACLLTTARRSTIP